MYSVCVCSWNHFEVGGKWFVNNLGGLPPVWTVLKASIRAQRIQPLLFVQNSISCLSKGRVLWWHKITRSVRGFHSLHHVLQSFTGIWCIPLAYFIVHYSLRRLVSFIHGFFYNAFSCSDYITLKWTIRWKWIWYCEDVFNGNLSTIKLLVGRVE